VGQQPAQLLVWTDIDPAFEADFNRWYDREHMAERMALPGFRWARRYCAAKGKRYLALYRTDGLAAFTSPAYLEAFAHQTAWSKKNLARMVDPMRRVGPIAFEQGQGTGAAISLILLAPGEADLRAVEHMIGNAMTVDGILGGHLLVTDPMLSTPLPNESQAGRVLAPVLVIEATGTAAAERMTAMAARELNRADTDMATLSLMWELAAS
jgi:hypothetical protein